MNRLHNICNKAFTFAQVKHPQKTTKLIRVALKVNSRLKRRKSPAGVSPHKPARSPFPGRRNGIEAANWAAGVPW
ncbi:hypothetical protein [Corynebacterium freiburgense]|uniref:hypothetical protein n=1 Tax=Corynebacterium freiburgense TaxID=556548 RepID=UPI0012EC73DE|nr:hypothetical protein [Corynebacterium freiburgense]WJZ03673.1 hypothetical protein CFREI_12080 [Corynebacterium freiburgense]